MPKAVVLGLGLKAKGRAEVMAINFAVSEKKCRIIVYYQNVCEVFEYEFENNVRIMG